MVVYDATQYIRASIFKVLKTILEATIIVIVVIFIFLGSIRPMTIPCSHYSTFFNRYLFFRVVLRLFN
ncbi:efflux RND transporter permease subunit [Candidatus Coxiella mudrowiae]|uniref:efflux RND transporter permease subunit n=1 Tax=Candidatus Coxiella mudrowiae TaxID=2054173 RepID=UPI003FA35F0E